MADNSILEIALEDDNNVWWTIIDAVDFWSLALLACAKSAIVSNLAYRHVGLDETKPWKFESQSHSESVLNVSCMFWGKPGPIIERLRYSVHNQNGNTCTFCLQCETT